MYLKSMKEKPFDYNVRKNTVGDKMEKFVLLILRNARLENDTILTTEKRQ